MGVGVGVGVRGGGGITFGADHIGVAVACYVHCIF